MTLDATVAKSLHDKKVRVWDALVRIVHWMLVVAFFVAYFTEDDLLTLHVWAGYTVGALVVLRVFWGIVGPRYARFSDFLYRPREVWCYLLDLLAFRAKRSLGHSPAGGVMIVALLLGLAATVWSGLELYAVEDNAGPLSGLRAKQMPSAQLVLSIDVLADEDDEENQESDTEAEGQESAGEGLWEDLHEALATVVFALVVLHIAGVLLASVVHRENLIGSMLTGYKRLE